MATTTAGINLLCRWGSNYEMKWNESGFRPPLCTYRLNWARRTSWGWWDDWDDTVLQTQDSKFEPWRSEAEYATSRSRRLPTILTFTRGWGRNIFCFFQTAETGNRTPNSGVKGSGAKHYPRAPALLIMKRIDLEQYPEAITVKTAHDDLQWRNVIVDQTLLYTDKTATLWLPILYTTPIWWIYITAYYDHPAMKCDLVGFRRDWSK